MVVDAWMQHPTAELLAHPMLETLRRWAGLGDTLPEIPFAATAKAYRAAGVDVAILSAWWGPSGPLVPNDLVAELVAAEPERFVGAASVPLERPREAVRELRRCVRELGLRALRIIPWLWDLPPNDRRYYPLYAECVELGIPFCLQVGHTGPLRRSEPGRPIPYLDDVALEFPELTLVGGHIGYPWTTEMVALATKYPNVHIDTSAYKPSRYPPELVDYLKGPGRRKVLFGTNYPMIPPEACLAEVDSLGLDAEARALFLGENAARVFGLEAGGERA